MYLSPCKTLSRDSHCILFLPQKIEERETLVQQRIVIATTEKDPSRYVPKGTSQERRQRQKRYEMWCGT